MRPLSLLPTSIVLLLLAGPASPPAAALEWTLEGMAGISATCIEADPVHGRLFVGTLEGFHYLDLAGGEWTERDWEGWIGRTVRAVAWHETQHERVLTGRVNAFFKGYIELSEDLGQTEQLVYASQAGAVNGFARDPLDVDRYYACTWHDITPGEILRSLDGGQSWTPLSGILHFALTSITTGPDGWVYAGGDERVTRSADGGDSWQSASGGLPEGYGVYCVAASPEVEGLLLASCDLGLYRSADAGEHWTRVAPQDCRAVAWGPTLLSVPGQPVFSFAGAATWDGGLLLSRDAGESWEDATGNLSGEAVDLAFSLADEGLHVATSAAGVYRSGFYDPAAVEGKEAPAGSSVRLRALRCGASDPALGFTLETAGPARLEVFDAAGRLEAVLLDRWLPAGTHAVAWRGAAGAGGLFFARLRTAAGGSTARIVGWK